MKEVYEILKTEDNNQALRRAVVFFSANPKITIEKIQELIKLANVNSQDDNVRSKKTALHLAVTNNKLVLVEALLTAGARYDIEDADGHTALCYAVTPNKLKPILPTIKEKMLLALVNDATAKVAKKFKYVPYEERAKTINRDKHLALSREMMALKVKITNIATLYSLSLNTFGKAVRATGTDVAAKHHQAVAKFRDLIQYHCQLHAFKAIMSKNDFYLNYCGLITIQLGTELYKHKSISNGIVNVRIIVITLSNGNHTLLLLNGKKRADGFPVFDSETILCNPYSDNENKRVFHGEEAILSYFNVDNDFDFALLKPKQIETVFENENPNPGDFLYAEDFILFLVKQTQEITLKEMRDEKTYNEYLKQFFESTLYKSYAEAQQNGILAEIQEHPAANKLLEEILTEYPELKKMSSSTTPQFDSEKVNGKNAVGAKNGADSQSAVDSKTMENGDKKKAETTAASSSTSCSAATSKATASVLK